MRINIVNGIWQVYGDRNRIITCYMPNGKKSELYKLEPTKKT